MLRQFVSSPDSPVLHFSLLSAVMASGGAFLLYRSRVAERLVIELEQLPSFESPAQLKHYFEAHKLGLDDGVYCALNGFVMAESVVSSSHDPTAVFLRRSIEVQPAKWCDEHRHLQKRKTRQINAAVPFYVAHPEDETRVYVTLGGLAHPLDLRMDWEGRDASGHPERQMVLSLGTPLLLVGEVRRLQQRPYSLADGEPYTPLDPPPEHTKKETAEADEVVALFVASKPSGRPYYLEVGEVSVEEFLSGLRKDKVERVRLVGSLLLAGAAITAATAFFYQRTEQTMVSCSLLP